MVSLIDQPLSRTGVVQGLSAGATARDAASHRDRVGGAAADPLWAVRFDGPKMLNSELSILMDYQCEISRMLSRERISKGTVS